MANTELRSMMKQKIERPGTSHSRPDMSIQAQNRTCGRSSWGKFAQAQNYWPTGSKARDQNQIKALESQNMVLLSQISLLNC